MSTLLELRTLLENQLSVGVTSSGTDPTSSLLNTYINNAIRKIARMDKPRELLTATPSNLTITANTNTITFPTTLIYPTSVYYKYNGGSWKEVLPKTMKEMIFTEGESNFLDTNNTGDPSIYCLQGTSFVFNKYFKRTEAGAIKVFGLSFPTALTVDASTTELPQDYDMLIVYESARLWYQRIDDKENQNYFESLMQLERSELRNSLSSNDQTVINLDPYVFGAKNNIDMSNPNTFFSS